MNFLTVLTNIINPLNVLMIVIGLSVGTIIGALPGLGILLGLTILLPFTFGLSSIPGIFLLLGAYCGGQFGGSISSILINAPGTPNAVCTTYDGYPLACQGKAKTALNAALYGSTFGGLFSCIALIFFAPLLASVAIKFGPADYFSLCLTGVIVVISTGQNFFKGLVMAGLGFLLASVGMDTVDGTPRFQFGRTELIGGINIICIALGMFALAEVMLKSYKSVKQNTESQIKVENDKFSLFQALKHWKVMLVSAVTGVLIGIIPGTGGSMAAYLSYDMSRSMAKDADTFGKGNVKGVIAPETANNAVTGAAMIPLLTLGVPGDSATAILLGALMMQGITPGVELFTANKTWVYTIMIGLIVVNILMCLTGKVFIKVFANATKISNDLLIPCIMLFVIAGAFSIRSYMFDVYMVIFIGLIGYVLRRLQFPIAPLAIGLVLGPLCEFNMRRALLISDGNPIIFLQRPISCAFLVIAVIVALMPIIKKVFAKIKAKKAIPA